MIENALTGEHYQLKAIDSIEPSKVHIGRITEICNEPEMYRWLYRDMFEGQAYPPDSAQDWIAWGTEGWEKGTHFVFVVVDRDGEIAAACDIKDADPDHAEIGYWVAKDHRGIMTNAVLAMLDLAGKAGFRRFFAEVHPGNERSQAVLQRTGFLLSEDEAQTPGHLVYNKNG